MAFISLEEAVASNRAVIRWLKEIGDKPLGIRLADGTEEMVVPSALQAAEILQVSTETIGVG